MQQGPYRTFSKLIKSALAANDIPSAIEHISYCSHEDAQEVYQILFGDLFKGSFHFLKEIKALKPQLWLVFLNRSDLCSEVGAKNLRKIVKKVIPILQKLNTELEFAPQLDDLIATYQNIVRLIATHEAFVECIAEHDHFLSADKKEFISTLLQTMPDIDEDILACYEPLEADDEDADLFIPSNDYPDDPSDALASNEANGPTFQDMQDPNTRRRFAFVNYLKVCYRDDEMKQFIVSNRDDFLLSLDPANINKYIFSTTIFSDQEKLVTLRILITTLESKDEKRRERAKNTLKYLLVKNSNVRKFFNGELSANLNISALLLLSVGGVAAVEAQAKTTDQMLETMNACFVPLGRAMRGCLAKNQVRVLTYFFTDKQNLDKLCTLYSFCNQEKCQQLWKAFWQFNNASGDYQILFNSVLNHYPNFLVRKALSHLTLSKNDAANLSLAVVYLSDAVALGYSPAYLARAAIHARKHEHDLMKNDLLSFLNAKMSDQESPSKASSTYRFLFEVYYATIRHVPVQLLQIESELNRVYPGLIAKFEQTLSQPLMVTKPKVVGTDLRDPIHILRDRFALLRMSLQAAPNEEAVDAQPALLFTAQNLPALMQEPPYCQAAPAAPSAPNKKFD